MRFGLADVHHFAAARRAAHNQIKHHGNKHDSAERNQPGPDTARIRIGERYFANVGSQASPCLNILIVRRILALTGRFIIFHRTVGISEFTLNVIPVHINFHLSFFFRLAAFVGGEFHHQFVKLRIGYFLIPRRYHVAEEKEQHSREHQPQNYPHYRLGFLIQRFFTPCFIGDPRPVRRRTAAILRPPAVFPPRLLTF